MAQGLALTDGGDRTLGQTADAVELFEGGRTEHTVGGQTGVALELGQRAGGVVTEDAVLTAGVETEGIEPALQLEDVVAAEHGGAAVEQAVAEAVAALDEGRPGLRTADPVDPQAAVLLEGPHGGRGGAAEGAGLHTRQVETERGEPALEIADRLAFAPRP